VGIASRSRWLLAVALALIAGAAHAAVGVTELAATDVDGPVTVFYPSDAEARPLRRGPFTVLAAQDGAPAKGNGRLVVISHGSGGFPWVYTDLARTLVEAGFTVAFPEHRGDNDRDRSAVGPASWKRRPQEVSRAIDAAGRDPRFARRLALGRVGMFGMSAGGHTALTLAGGRWSPSRLAEHCRAHIAEDFQACVGLTTRLDGGALDGVKKAVALWVLRMKLNDPTWYTHTDPRIAAIVAGVPFAADFDAASLATPRVPLGLVTARQDRWLVPRFHSDAILAACAGCERIADLAHGGHGALLSPLPPDLPGLLADLLKDPPGFDRAAVLPELFAKIAAFFRAHLPSY